MNIPQGFTAKEFGVDRDVILAKATRSGTAFQYAGTGLKADRTGR